MKFCFLVKTNKERIVSEKILESSQNIKGEIVRSMECNSTINDLAGLWHRRLGHASYGVISKLARRDLVIGLSKSSY